MTNPAGPLIDHRSVELDGIRYVILRESAFRWLCEKAHFQPRSEDSLTPPLDLDHGSLSEKLVRRRRAAGLSQAELSRRAGIRPETLNRIERGRSTPDFSTVRKLVIAMNAAEHEQLAREDAGQSHRESSDADQQ